MAWLIAVHGRHAGFAHNIAAEPRVRVKFKGRWHDARAMLVPIDEAVISKFSRYARLGPKTLGLDSMLVKLLLEERDAE